MDPMEAARRFLLSKTHTLLEDADCGLMSLPERAEFDMWEAEQVTGDPRNSVAVRASDMNEVSVGGAPGTYPAIRSHNPRFVPCPHRSWHRSALVRAFRRIRILVWSRCEIGSTPNMDL